MIINVKKTFYPVGQGCFYSERISTEKDEKTIVYDCGSFNKEHLKKEIIQSDITQIDYLVLSHFHRDHINGIEELLKKKCDIKNVIIPKIDALDVAFYLGTKNTIEHIMIDPNAYFGENTKIIRVSNSDEPTVLEDNSALPSIISHSTSFPIIIRPSKEEIIWFLKFYADPTVFLGKPLDKRERDIIDGIKDITDYKINKNELIETYKKLSNKDVNLTTMSMASYPSNELWPFHNFNRHSVSVMNGDTLLNTDIRIQKYLKHYFELNQFKIDFHIPHHASHKNLSRPFCEWNLKRGIVFSGYENDYGHPSGIILRKFADANIPFKVMTEYDKQIVKRISYLL
ncbi:MAG: MBL fold metallo-hydrolase [Paludibacter sp.]